MIIRGWMPFPDGKHCYIYSSQVKLVSGYTGEWCDDCDAWVASIDKIVSDGSYPCVACIYGEFAALRPRVVELEILASAASSRGWTVEAGVAFMPCARCAEQGVIPGWEHACGGNESTCSRICPVEAQLQCEHCHGTGKVPAKAGG